VQMKTTRPTGMCSNGRKYEQKFNMSSDVNVWDTCSFHAHVKLNYDDGLPLRALWEEYLLKTEM